MLPWAFFFYLLFFFFNCSSILFSAYYRSLNKSCLHLASLVMEKKKVSSWLVFFFFFLSSFLSICFLPVFELVPRNSRFFFLCAVKTEDNARPLRSCQRNCWIAELCDVLFGSDFLRSLQRVEEVSAELVAAGKAHGVLPFDAGF